MFNYVHIFLLHLTVEYFVGEAGHKGSLICFANLLECVAMDFYGARRVGQLGFGDLYRVKMVLIFSYNLKFIL